MVGTVMRQPAEQSVQPRRHIHGSGGIELGDQGIRVALPEAMVLHQSSKLHDHADHPLQHEPTEQVPNNGAMAKGQDDQQGLNHQDTSTIQKAQTPQPLIHRFQSDALKHCVHNQANTSKTKQATGQQMVLKPATPDSGCLALDRQQGRAFWIARITSIPAVMQTVQARIGEIGEGHRPTQSAGQQVLRPWPTEQGAMNHLMGAMNRRA